MTWYYAREYERIGPIADEEFHSLVSAGTIASGTLVWRQGMENWRPYGEVLEAGPVDARPRDATLETSRHFCVECGNVFPAEDMIAYSGLRVCGTCKPIFFQRLKEGAPLPKTVEYAGFGIRLVAFILDRMILGIANGVFALILSLAVTDETPAMGFVAAGIIGTLGFISNVIYETWFVGKFGATPGKMACGLEVTRANGAALTYARALGRTLAKILSSLVLYIGFIMILFDEEKRGLHDIICDTRVRRK